MSKIKNLQDLERARKQGLSSIYPDRVKIAVGAGTCGLIQGAAAVLEAIREELKKKGLPVEIALTGCIGFCQKEPLVDLLKPGWPRLTYCEMTPKKAKRMVGELSRGRIVPEWILAKAEEEGLLIEGKVRRYRLNGLPGGIDEVPLYKEVPFYKKQMRIARRNCGLLNPEKVNEYIARGGYFSLYKVLTECQPQEVIEEIKKSGLRGRGGGGFPTGRKWESCRNAPGRVKYVICNANEGDPGAYMDRNLLEGDPHSVVEGMVIGAYAIGAHEGYVYVRSEYAVALFSLEGAISQAEEYGLLGRDIFGSGFDFSLEISLGAGAFVSGESTALMASIEGRVGEPRAKHIHTVEKGLWQRPSCLNNVETWAHIPVILARGSDWFSKIGTEGSKGTKALSLTGKIRNTGLVEVPMGTTLKEIIHNMGGGIPEGKKFKAVQIGGPSGGCVPEELIDMPLDFEELTRVGSMMGGMVVMDEDNCMVDMARYFLGFFREESCGKCTSCREGIKRTFQILTRITQGKGEEGDIDLLEQLSWVMANTSLCALGATAPNPVLATIRYFRDEYEAHIKNKRCPAKECRGLIA